MIPAGAAAQSTPNPDFYYGAVIDSFRKHDPGMVHFSLLYKAQESEALDLILVRGGSPRSESSRRTAIQEFHPGDLLGLFLVERSNPSRAYELIIESFLGQVFVERAAQGAITLIPESDYGRSRIRQKYFYSSGEKRLLQRLDFGPVTHFTVRKGMDVFGGRFISPHGRRQPNVSFAVTPDGNGFESYPHTAALPEDPSEPGTVPLSGDSSCSIRTEPRLSNTAVRRVACVVDEQDHLFHPPRADFERFKAARPERVANGLSEEHAIFNETIGPYQLQGEKLWFGLDFFDGEGRTGVGAFGAFDVKKKVFDMHYLPELVDWSVSALLVEPDSIWLGLARHSVGTSYSGGLIRWDRNTRTVQRWPETPVITGLLRQGERLYMATGEGAAIFENGEVVRYLLDVDQEGSYRLVQHKQR